MLQRIDTDAGRKIETVMATRVDAIWALVLCFSLIPDSHLFQDEILRGGRRMFDDGGRKRRQEDDDKEQDREGPDTFFLSF